MSKLKLFLIIFIILLLPACERKPASYDQLDQLDYNKPANDIVEITSKINNSKYIDAARLNEELLKEKSLSKKAHILMKMKKISGDITLKK